MSVLDLIKHIGNGDTVKASAEFSSQMTDRIMTETDGMKKEVSASMFSVQEETEEERAKKAKKSMRSARAEEADLQSIKKHQDKKKRDLDK